MTEYVINISFKIKAETELKPEDLEALSILIRAKFDREEAALGDLRIDIATNLLE